MQADIASDLRERRGRREILGQHLSDGVEPWLAVFDVALSCGGGRELKRKALERERRVRVGLCEFPTDVMREHRRPPVSEAAEPSGFLIGLDHNDPRAIRSEQIFVPLLRRHLDHGPGDRILLKPREGLADIASDHHGKAAVRMTVP